MGIEVSCGARHPLPPVRLVRLSATAATGRLLSVTRPERDPVARSLAEYWPIFGLRLATPRLVLTPLQDDDLVETLDLILAGIHDSGPDAVQDALDRRAAGRVDRQHPALLLELAGRLDGRGLDGALRGAAVRRAGGDAGSRRQGLLVTRTVSTPGRGWAPRTRATASAPRCARPCCSSPSTTSRQSGPNSGAFLDNPASLRVSEKLGYRPDGTAVLQRRPGERAVEQRLTLEPCAVPPVGLGGAGPWAARLPGVLRASDRGGLNVGRRRVGTKAREPSPGEA